MNWVDCREFKPLIGMCVLAYGRAGMEVCVYSDWTWPDGRVSNEFISSGHVWHIGLLDATAQ